jgi:hypothetical protein
MKGAGVIRLRAGSRWWLTACMAGFLGVALTVLKTASDPGSLAIGIGTGLCACFAAWSAARAGVEVSRSDVAVRGFLAHTRTFSFGEIVAVRNKLTDHRVVPFLPVAVPTLVLASGLEVDPWPLARYATSGGKARTEWAVASISTGLRGGG